MSYLNVTKTDYIKANYFGQTKYNVIPKILRTQNHKCKFNSSIIESRRTPS